MSRVRHDGRVTGGIAETFLCQVLNIAEPINVRAWAAGCNLCHVIVDLPIGFSVERIEAHCHQPCVST